MNIIVCAGLEVTPGDEGEEVSYFLGYLHFRAVGVVFKNLRPIESKFFSTVTFKIINENILNLRMRNAS